MPGAVDPGMPGEGPDTPKISAPIARQNLNEAAIRRVKQIGVNYVLTGGPRIPWAI
jgi:mannonate dehydratase